ncbi:3-hydroxyisobutyrate dehydrogenase-like beta-hydroxyacid dehydrogenase [Duganella sp. 1224]|uniref:NAD(P)-dependent oxidoreductase n=1 Tax=Duganella sp. 1224 TaxID=2587052 RepID=UPI0015C97EFB|nr:NAD(P)-dependent oxidoreductase [Duganella sp. 1224]NYE62359.1 3-hydroxyisobutyrate dehydrogenase-like beta-hydroxyacid dehydrogenase [Duganella sp. 1224]
MKVSFIGIGAMGAAMVPHLVRAGHEVSVWNRNRAAAQAIEGVTVLASPAEAFQADAVMTILANDDAVRSVILDSGALANANKDCVHVMMATISLALVDELAERHREAGVALVSAPVFGVPAVAAAAQLNVLAAGDARAIARVQPLLDAVGRKTWPLGDDPKRANVVKISGNMMIAQAFTAMGEAAHLSESYGVSAADLLNVLTNTLFTAPSYQRYGGFIATNSFEPGFKLPLGLKDVNLALSAAEAKGAVLPVAEQVRANMQEAIAQGLQDRDWSVAATIRRTR